MRRNFVERSLHSLTSAARHALDSEAFAARPGLMQSVDARIKCAGGLLWIIAAVCARRWDSILFILVSATAVTVASRIPLSHVWRREWLPVVVFTGLIALPGLFLVPGPKTPVGPLELSQYGITSAVLLLLRTLTSATVAFMVVLTTPWTQLIRAMRSLGMPALVTAILAMTQRYIFLLLNLAEELFIARRARMVGGLTPQQARRISTATAGVMLDRALHMGTEVGDAMQARGFRGDFPTLRPAAPTGRDWLMLSAFVVLGAVTLIWGLT